MGLTVVNITLETFPTVTGADGTTRETHRRRWNTPKEIVRYLSQISSSDTSHTLSAFVIPLMNRTPIRRSIYGGEHIGVQMSMVNEH